MLLAPRATFLPLVSPPERFDATYPSMTRAIVSTGTLSARSRSTTSTWSAVRLYRDGSEKGELASDALEVTGKSASTLFEGCRRSGWKTAELCPDPTECELGSGPEG